ncbi:cilia- and flagella-associated protein 69 isoform X2 [Halyomorpha halys]
MYFVPDEIYHPLLEIMYQLSLQPPIANLFQSLGCMDFWIRKVSIRHTLSIREAFIKETTSNLLWSVLRCPDTFGNEPTLNSQSLSIMRGWLRREVLFGQRYQRNNIAALVLQALISIPKLEISKSGILADIGLLAFASEFGTDNTWANKYKFKPMREDLEFKKILITILLIMNEDPNTKMVLSENRAINAIAYNLHLKHCKWACQWDKNQQFELINICLYALPLFSKHFQKQYTRSGATIRILQLIEKFTYRQQNLRLIKNCCLCLHLLISNGISLKHFRELKTSQVLTNLILYILQNLKLNLLVQTIVNYCLCAITNLVQDHKESKGILASDSKTVCTLIFSKFQRPSISDTKLSYSLLIAACDFVWQCIYLNDVTQDFFFEGLGVHALLNVMEDAPFIVQTFYLSFLADVCISPKSVPQVVTWRGKERSNDFFKILCNIWRKQEEMKGVERNEYGCIKDIEHSLMGNKQTMAVEENGDISSSPALVDMIGCARPKIAVAIHLITRRHYEKVKLATSIYCVPFDDAIAPEDQITLQIIQCYEELKQGEIMSEVRRAVEKIGVKLLPLDTEVLHQLIMRLIGLANKVERNQRKILEEMRKKEIDREHKHYADIDEYKLARDIKKVVARDSYLTVSNKIYREWKHKKYEAFLENIEELYKDKREQNYHQTFYHPRNFIVVKTGRDAHIISIKQKKDSTARIVSQEEEDEINPEDKSILSDE